MGVQPRRHQREHLRTQARSAVRLDGQRPGELREFVHAPLQVVGEAIELQHLAVVGQVHRHRLVRHEAVDRRAHRHRVEVDRRGRRKDELAPIDVEVAIGDAEIVPGKDPARVEVDDTVVVQRVAGRVDEFQVPSADADALAVARHEHAVLGDRHDVPVELPVAVLTVDRYRAGDELCRVDQVTGAPRVRGATGVRQVAHQLARATGVVEVDVRRQDPVDLVAPDAACLERCEQIRHRQRGARIHERRTPVVHQKVAGVKLRPDIVGVDGRNAVREVGQLAFDVHAAPRSSRRKLAAPPPPRNGRRGYGRESRAWSPASRSSRRACAQRLLGVRNPCCAEK